MFASPLAKRVARGRLDYRTLREEEMLRSEPPGYADYMTRVRYPWVQAIW